MIHSIKSPGRQCFSVKKHDFFRIKMARPIFAFKTLFSFQSMLVSKTSKNARYAALFASKGNVLLSTHVTFSQIQYFFDSIARKDVPTAFFRIFLLNAVDAFSLEKHTKDYSFGKNVSYAVGYSLSHISNHGSTESVPYSFVYWLNAVLESLSIRMGWVPTFVTCSTGDIFLVGVGHG